MLQRTDWSRLPQSAGSIFARYNREALRHHALNLAQGFPDFPPQARLLEALERTARLPQSHQYGPPEGVPALREAVAGMLQDLYGVKIDPVTELTITAGATEAIFIAAQAMLRPGDEAIFFSPAFECYEPAIRLAGATPVSVPLNAAHLPDWDAFRARLRSRTRLVIVNSPHNPTGTCWPQADLDMLATLADTHGFRVLSDEVYHTMVIPPQRHVCAWSRPPLAATAAMVGSLGKILHVTGWRLGYAVAPRAVTDEMRKLHQFVTYASATPLQHAAAAALSDADSYRGLRSFAQQRRDRFLSGLEGSRFAWRPSHGGYFQLLDYTGISDDADTTFSEYLLKSHRVAALPLSSFGACPSASRQLRFCVAKQDDTLDKATAILRGI
ncbi:MAG TPA: aminotransferase class I/II-fold pyridoxal phosphate-dependent enzyme [Trinickia sp.]